MIISKLPPHFMFPLRKFAKIGLCASVEIRATRFAVYLRLNKILRLISRRNFNTRSLHRQRCRHVHTTLCFCLILFACIILSIADVGARAHLLILNSNSNKQHRISLHKLQVQHDHYWKSICVRLSVVNLQVLQLID